MDNLISAEPRRRGIVWLDGAQTSYMSPGGSIMAMNTRGDFEYDAEATAHIKTEQPEQYKRLSEQAGPAQQAGDTLAGWRGMRDANQQAADRFAQGRIEQIRAGHTAQAQSREAVLRDSKTNDTWRAVERETSRQHTEFTRAAQDYREQAAGWKHAVPMETVAKLHAENPNWAQKLDDTDRFTPGVAVTKWEFGEMAKAYSGIAEAEGRMRQNSGEQATKRLEAAHAEAIKQQGQKAQAPQQSKQATQAQKPAPQQAGKAAGKPQQAQQRVKPQAAQKPAPQRAQGSISERATAIAANHWGQIKTQAQAFAKGAGEKLQAAKERVQSFAKGTGQKQGTGQKPQQAQAQRPIPLPSTPRPFLRARGEQTPSARAQRATQQGQKAQQQPVKHAATAQATTKPQQVAQDHQRVKPASQVQKPQQSRPVPAQPSMRAQHVANLKTAQMQKTSAAKQDQKKAAGPSGAPESVAKANHSSVPEASRQGAQNGASAGKSTEQSQQKARAEKMLSQHELRPRKLPAAGKKAPVSQRAAPARPSPRDQRAAMRPTPAQRGRIQAQRQATAQRQANPRAATRQAPAQPSARAQRVAAKPAPRPAAPAKKAAKQGR